MCWSAPVSLAFGVLDLLCIAVLVCRRRGDDVRYAAMLAGVAAQELAQYGLWADGLGGACTRRKALLSFATMAGSHAIPVAMLLLAHPKCRRQAAQGAGMLAAEAAIVLGSVAATGWHCVEVGPRGHQVWPCARAVHGAGGFPLYVLSLVLYAGAIVRALDAMLLPPAEAKWITRIGTGTVGAVYLVYAWTLEACSVWCWSAFSLGLYLVLRPAAPQ